MIKKGELLSIQVVYYKKNSQKGITYQGICVKKTNKGWASSVSIENSGITHTFPIYSPFTKSIKVLKNNS